MIALTSQKTKGICLAPPGLQVESKGKEDKKGRKKFNERLQANVTKLTGKGEWMIPMAGMIGQCFGV